MVPGLLGQCGPALRLDPAPRSALRSCQPGAARCRWRLDSSLIQHPATQPSSLSTQRIQPLGAWVEAGSSRRAPGWVMYMGTGSSLGEAGWQSFGRKSLLDTKYRKGGRSSPPMLHLLSALAPVLGSPVLAPAPREAFVDTNTVPRSSCDKSGTPTRTYPLTPSCTSKIYHDQRESG